MSTAAGASLRYHGDFDWEGVRIALLLRDRFGAQPWRFDEDSYRAGVARYRERTQPLDGRPVKPEASAALVTAMQETGLEFHEEAVLDQLLDDLAAEANSHRPNLKGRASGRLDRSTRRAPS